VGLISNVISFAEIVATHYMGRAYPTVEHITLRLFRAKYS
jgi:DUF917 family protein